MRKAFTFLAALVLAVPFCFAQVNTNQMAKRVNATTVQKMENVQFDARTHAVVEHLLQTSGVTKYDNNIRNAHYRATGNPIWELTMSYCGDAAFASSVGLGSPGDVYWGIKIESAALVGRNNLTDVQLFIAYAGSYTLNIYSGANPSGTAIATQTITATDADTMTWKNIHFNTPVAITQSQDLWVTFHCSTLAYPATGVVGNEYDNGKYISLDGSTWNLISAYGLDYTWMIKAISDTYVELPPQLTLTGPTTVINGDTATYTVSSPNATSYAWNITADYTTNSGTTAQALWLTDGVKQVIASATNNAGTTTDTLDVTVVSCDPITTFPFAEGFESEIVCWTMVSMDPANDDRFGLYADASAYEGSYDFRFSSFHSASDYNQYLITPEITLPSTGDYMVKFKYHGYVSTDSFRVMTSTTTNAISSFTQLADYQTVSTSWDEVALLLPAGTKYVAINYYGGYQYYLYVDAFTIEALTVPVATLTGPAAVEVGTSATFNVTTSPAADSYAWSVDGVAVASTTDALTHTFTTAGNHTVQVITTNTVGNDTASMVVEAYVCEPITTFPFTEDFEEGSLRCWTMISMDPTNDDYFGVFDDGSYAYDGTYDFWFSSYSYADDYNQYLITPELQLPTTGTYMVKFYYQGGSSAESFKVMTSSTTSDLSSFSVLLDVPTTSTDWTEVAVLLPAGTKYVAINYYGDFVYFLYVDNFSVELLGAPSVTISGPASIPSGSQATFTAHAPLATSFAWTVDGSTVPGTTNTMTTTFATGGDHTVAVTASNSEGSNTASMTVNVVSCDPITNFPFVENFENVEAFDCWTFIDADGDGFNWDLNYLRDAEDDDTGLGYGHNGSYGLVGSASWNNSAGALNPDNWMITPAMAIPATGTYKLTWYVKGQDADYAEEYYSVYVATTNSVDAFTATSPMFSGYSTDEWELKTVDLSSYSGQTIYIAFRHHNVSDMFYIDIDDISVSLGSGLENHDMNISVYPNPATNNITVSGEGIQEVQVMDINGRTLLTFNHGGQLNIGSLANGMYLVRVVTENGVQMDKIIKK